ncbi:hypothetical protein CEP53_002562 [Fusarium sp. AF-6]|nr:hypothetical protein CEP53_002562 [Fusarium sp. AF-6]
MSSKYIRTPTKPRKVYSYPNNLITHTTAQANNHYQHSTPQLQPFSNQLTIIMHFTSIITGAAALFASASMAQPTARQAPVAYANIMVYNSADHSQQPVRIPFGQLTNLDQYKVTKLDLISLSVNIPDIPSPDVKDVVCQRYNDKYGVQLGSTEFTYENPALISTNPVEFGWVLCYVRGKSS